MDTDMVVFGCRGMMQFFWRLFYLSLWRSRGAVG